MTKEEGLTSHLREENVSIQAVSLMRNWYHQHLCPGDFNPCFNPGLVVQQSSEFIPIPDHIPLKTLPEHVQEIISNSVASPPPKKASA